MALITAVITEDKKLELFKEMLKFENAFGDACDIRTHFEEKLATCEEEKKEYYTSRFVRAENRVAKAFAAVRAFFKTLKILELDREYIQWCYEQEA